MEYYIIQILGIIGTIIGIIRMQMPDRHRILMFNTYQCIPLFFHYLFLGGIVAAIQCFVSAFRTFFLAKLTNTKHKNLIVFFCVGIVTTLSIPFLDSTISWLTLISLYVAVMGEMQTDELKLRLSLLISKSLWLIFAIMIGSWGGIISTVLAIGSIIIALKRFYFPTTGWFQL